MGHLELRRIAEAYVDAVFAKDVEAFLALYDREVRVFDAWGKWSYEGISEWRGMVTEWFSSLGTERVKVSFSGETLHLSEDMGCLTAFVRYTGQSASGEDLPSMDNRISWVVVRRGDSYKVSHEHTSAPGDFQSAKLVLSRS